MTDGKMIVEMIMLLRAGAMGQHDDLGIMNEAAELIKDLHRKNVRMVRELKAIATKYEAPE